MTVLGNGKKKHLTPSKKIIIFILADERI